MAKTKDHIPPYWWIIPTTALTVVFVVAIIGRTSAKVPSHIFDSPDLPGSGKCMDPVLIKMLSELEKKSRRPVFQWISSAARTIEHNRKVGGVKNSAHLIPTCKAVDIKTPSTTVRNQLIHLAKQIGFRRIGIAPGFIHLDIDHLKPHPAAWGYPKGSPPPFNPFSS